MHVITQQNQPLTRNLDKKESVVRAVTSEPRPETAETSEGGPRLLARGLAGEDVRKLQQDLKDAGHTLAVDGIFGPETEGALLAFQRKNGLKDDGIAGPKTFGAISNGRGREFSEQTAPRATTPAPELPGQAVSARSVIQAAQSSGDPQAVLKQGLPSSSPEATSKAAAPTVTTDEDTTADKLIGAAAVTAVGAGAIALANRPANFKGVLGGEHVYTAAQKLQAEADRTGRAQKFDFNGKDGTRLVAKPGDSIESILKPYTDKNGVTAEKLGQEAKKTELREKSLAERSTRGENRAYRKAVNDFLKAEPSAQGVQLKAGQTVADLGSKLTGQAAKGAKEAGEAAVEKFRADASAGGAPKPAAVSADPAARAARAENKAYRSAVNDYLKAQPSAQGVQLRTGQTVADLGSKLDGATAKGAKQAGEAAVEALRTKPSTAATSKPVLTAAEATTKAAQTSAATTTRSTLVKAAGRAAVVGAAAMDAVELANAHQVDQARGDGKNTELKASAAGIGLSWGGAIAGAKAGALTAARFGLVAGPKGAAIAGVVGGVVGAVAGSIVGDAAKEGIRAADASSPAPLGSIGDTPAA